MPAENVVIVHNVERIQDPEPLWPAPGTHTTSVRPMWSWPGLDRSSGRTSNFVPYSETVYDPNPSQEREMFDPQGQLLLYVTHCGEEASGPVKDY